MRTGENTVTAIPIFREKQSLLSCRLPAYELRPIVLALLIKNHSI